MIASEVIKRLQELIEKHGDKKVKTVFETVCANDIDFIEYVESLDAFFTYDETEI